VMHSWGLNTAAHRQQGLPTQSVLARMQIDLPHAPTRGGYNQGGPATAWQPCWRQLATAAVTVATRVIAAPHCRPRLCRPESASTSVLFARTSGICKNHTNRLGLLRLAV